MQQQILYRCAQVQQLHETITFMTGRACCQYMDIYMYIYTARSRIYGHYVELLVAES